MNTATQIFREMYGKFFTTTNPSKVKSQKVSKHKASHKGYKHSHNLSKGELNHLNFVRG